MIHSGPDLSIGVSLLHPYISIVLLFLLFLLSHMFHDSCTPSSIVLHLFCSECTSLLLRAISTAHWKCTLKGIPEVPETLEAYQKGRRLQLVHCATPLLHVLGFVEVPRQKCTRMILELEGQRFVLEVTRGMLKEVARSSRRGSLPQGPMGKRWKAEC